MKNPNQKKRGT